VPVSTRVPVMMFHCDFSTQSEDSWLLRDHCCEANISLKSTKPQP
jgi:hypothetical protein